MPETSRERVVVGLSGGVDSSVAALLLKQRGYDVHGLFMFNWEEDEDDYCSAAEDFQDARRVCEELDIPLHRVNFANEYREQVFAHFLAEYQAGRTPNPDVLCNREIKFGVFFDHARRLGAEWIATGHYARVDRSAAPARLLRARDENKDQTYFLHAVESGRFERVLFPIGELEKSEVRKLAREAGFVNFNKRDSTGICFIGERPFREFLSRYLPAQPGPIKSDDGQVLGEHRGLMYYTLGQRQGLGIGGHSDRDERPWYVIAKDLERNVLIVGQGHEHPRLMSEALNTAQVHWIGDEPEAFPLRCTARARYRQADKPCVVEALADGIFRVRFDSPQRAVTPGQFVVFYDGERCLGGSVIDTVMEYTKQAATI
ncbi:MAG: tRNA 2-thiouridine(34) synthase MnmA [Gammaproteobacteria bacterium]